jgi:hypothetical protein
MPLLPQVRHVLMLALRRWRCFVCTAPSEASAIERLVSNGARRACLGWRLVAVALATSRCAS